MRHRMSEMYDRLVDWITTTVQITRGGVVLIVAGFTVLTVFNVVGAWRTEQIGDQRARDLETLIAAVSYEGSLRAYETCVTAVEGRLALRETMLDEYDAVRDTMVDFLTAIEVVGGETVDALAAEQRRLVEARRDEQRRLLDQRRPSITIADDCPPRPEPLPPAVHDGDD